MGIQEQEITDDFSSDGERLWFVTVKFRSAVRLPDGQDVHLMASVQSCKEIMGVKMENLRFKDKDSNEFTYGIGFKAAGKFVGLEEAVRVLANLATGYVHVLAMACNASFSEEYELMAYSPPQKNLPGRFFNQVLSEPVLPAVVVRTLSGSDLVDILKLLDPHEDKNRIHRAMAHFGMAQQFYQPFSKILSAEHLFIAVEILQPVVYRRICKERGLDPKVAKDELAKQAGFDFKVSKPTAHLYEYEAHLKLSEILENDSDCYKALKNASDQFEHGYKEFDVIRGQANSAVESAFRYVRRAILRELGLQGEHALYNKKFDHPLTIWHPKLEVFGSYTDDENVPYDGVDQEMIKGAWPIFHGIDLTCHVSSIVDDEEAKTRDITFKAAGSCQGLSASQKVSVEQTRWAMPGESSEPMHSQLDVEITVNERKLKTNAQNEVSELKIHSS